MLAKYGARVAVNDVRAEAADATKRRIERNGGTAMVPLRERPPVPDADELEVALERLHVRRDVERLRLREQLPDDEHRVPAGGHDGCSALIASEIQSPSQKRRKMFVLKLMLKFSLTLSRLLLPMTLARSIISVWLFLTLCASTVYAHREDYLDETLVFVTLERGELEPEYWFDMGRDDFVPFMRHHLALEYGITNHWMVDARVTALHERSDGLDFDSARLETRYRFFEEGTLPIDVALSGEINAGRDEAGREIWASSRG